MPLTVIAVKKAKPGPKPIKLSHGKGLYLLVNPVLLIETPRRQRRSGGGAGLGQDLGSAYSR